MVQEDEASPTAVDTTITSEAKPAPGAQETDDDDEEDEYGLRLALEKIEAAREKKRRRTTMLKRLGSTR